MPAPVPVVAVVIAAYNAEGMIARAVRSALAEPEVAEVLVVDDASHDGTPAAALSADDGSGRLKILQQLENRGPAAARNRAMAESRAPWLTVLDADDFILPGRMKGLLAASDEADLVADDMWQVPVDNINGPKIVLIGEKLSLPCPVGFAAFVRSNISDISRERAELGFIKPLMRRAFLDRHSIRYQENMRLGEDYELYARALACGARLWLLPAQGYVSVVRTDSLSARHSEQDLLNLRECDRGLLALPGLKADEKRALLQHMRSIDCRLQWRLLINAVKKRQPGAALACFARPWPVPAYLAARLWEQFYLRAIRGKNPPV